jgi:hypothetical protein
MTRTQASVWPAHDPPYVHHTVDLNPVKRPAGRLVESVD